MKKDKYKTICFYIASFLIPFLMLISYLSVNKIALSDLLISDSNKQYINLFKYFKEVLNGNESLFYSFSKGIGGPMFGTFLYYLSSPLNIFLIFIKDSMIPDFIGFLSIMKIGLSGLTMYHLLNKSNSNHVLINLSFAISYALMSYNLIYYFNIMWLDIVYLTPLVILGCDEILKNKKSKLYICCLFLSIVSNYYISFMLCIFVLIYFIYKLYVNYDIKKDRQQVILIIKKFIISSLLAALLASFILIPLISELGTNYRETLFYNRTGFDGGMNVFAQIGFNLQTEKVLYAIPYIFCGYLTYFSIISWLIVTKNKKEKKAFLMIGFFMLSSLLLKSLNLFWHGGSTPILFCFRWTFLLDFFLIKIATDNFKIINSIDKNKLLIWTIIIAILILIGTTIGDVEQNYYLLFLNILFMILTILLLDIVTKYKNTFYKISLLLICLLQSFILIKTNFVTNKNIANKKDNKVYISEINELQTKLKSIDQNYRISGKSVYKQNELFASGIGRIEQFLSSIDGSFIKFLQNSGYQALSSDIRDNNDQIIINELLGIKYYYNIDCNNELISKEKIVVANKKINVCYDERALSLGYMIKNNNYVAPPVKDFFQYQNNFFNFIGGYSVYEKLDATKLEKNYYEIINSHRDNVYVGYNNEFSYPENIIANDINLQENKTGYIKINNDKEKVRLKFTSKEIINNISFYRVNKNNFQKIYNSISKSQANVISMNKNKLELHINSDSIYNTLLIMLPYDKNFVIKVDGKKVSYQRLYDTFIGLKLGKGQHNIEITYIPKDFYFGLAISVIMIFITNRYLKSKVSVNECTNV